MTSETLRRLLAAGAAVAALSTAACATKPTQSQAELAYSVFEAAISSAGAILQSDVAAGVIKADSAATIQKALDTANAAAAGAYSAVIAGNTTDEAAKLKAIAAALTDFNTALITALGPKASTVPVPVVPAL